MIPKIVHYCWFGNGPKGKKELRCIESWKKYCPEYEIIEWNETNVDLDMMPFVREAYDAKKYAFVSVENYQIVSVGDSVAEAEKEDYALLKDNGKTNVDYDTEKLTAVVSDIHEVVVNGNSQYYFQLQDSNQVFIAPISLNAQLPFVKAGDTVTIEYVNDESTSQTVSSITIQ